MRWKNEAFPFRLIVSPTPEDGAAISMRVPSFLPGFTSINKERSQGDPGLLSNGKGTKLRESVLDILPRLVLGYAKSQCLLTRYVLLIGLATGNQTQDWKRWQTGFGAGAIVTGSEEEQQIEKFSRVGIEPVSRTTVTAQNR